ncbi:GNAT family N-acetyltransferase [Candidatus Dojkabacteria bacterium]|nr:GNAT family N-acetyltransferase [Candidatus Dojkabacteria bacterium]
MEFQIQKATLLDLDEICKLNLKLFENEQNWHQTNRREWVDEPSGRSYFAARLLGENGIVLKAIVDGKVVGYLCGGWLRKYPFRKEKLFAELENMYVEEEFRNNGIGKQLVEEFEKWCKTKGVETITVECVYENEKALKFYNTKGFKNHSVKLEKRILDD